MKKLIIYDESCPMCKLYTKGMVAADTSGCLTRISNGEIDNKSITDRIDLQRARHEIPLVDLSGGETLYGVDTWIYTFGQRNQSLKKLLSRQWFKAFLKKLYAFISYNRRIIITAAPRRWQLLDLQPDFHAGHRLAFILTIFGVTTSLWLADSSSIWQLLLLIITQIITTQLYLLTQLSINTVETILDYTGHLAMSLFVGTLLITIGLVIGWSALEAVGYAFMIGQHFIRVYRLGLSPWLSVWFTVLVFLLLL